MTRFTVEGTGEPLYVYAIYDHERVKFVWPRYKDAELKLALKRCEVLNGADADDKEVDAMITQQLLDHGFERNGDRWEIKGSWGSASNLTQDEAYKALLGWQGKDENR